MHSLDQLTSQRRSFLNWRSVSWELKPLRMAACPLLPRRSLVQSRFWAILPLDPTNSSFSKVLENERSFKETFEIKFFDLDSSKWTTYRNHILGKSDRYCLKKILIFSTSTSGTVPIDLFKSYSQFTSARVKELVDSFWNNAAITPGMSDEDKNKSNDQCIISNKLEEYLLSSLTILAQNKVKIEIEDWQKTLDGVTYICGGTLYWHIANIMQPNNDCIAVKSR